MKNQRALRGEQKRKGLNPLLTKDLTLLLLVPRTRIELVQGLAPRDFKSLASTNSATQAHYYAI